MEISKQIEEIEGLKRVVKQTTKEKEHMGKIKNNEIGEKEKLLREKNSLGQEVED